MQSERSEKPVFDNQLKIGGVLLAWPHQRFRNSNSFTLSPHQLGMRSHVVSFRIDPGAKEFAGATSARKS